MMRRIHRGALVVAGLGLVLGSVSGCSAASEEQAPGPPSDTPATPSPTVTQVESAELGVALDRLLYGTDEVSSDDGRCLVRALRDHDVDPETERVLVAAEPDDWGRAVELVSAGVGVDESETLVSSALRRDLDACVNRQFGTDEEVKALKVEPAARSVTTGEPNLEPKYTFGENEAIYSADDLRPGLVSMFSSFDPDSLELIEESSKCMAEVVMAAEFTEETLLFIAGGAPIGHGSIVEHLPEETDRQTWGSAQFLTSLSDCTTEEARKQANDDEDGEGPP